MKKLYAIALAAGLTALAASSVAAALDKALPYRIGFDDYSRYLWVGRFTVASFVLGVAGLISGLAVRKGLPVILGFVGLGPLLLIGGVHSGPNPQAWCFSNLRQIEAAKDMLARERGLSNGSAVTLTDISRSLPAGFQLRCAKGGTYLMNRIGGDARCTFHGSIAEMEAEWQGQTQAQPGGGALRGEPVLPQTNQPSAAAGSGR